MGQAICVPSEEDSNRLKQYEALVKEQEVEKLTLEKKTELAKKKRRQYKHQQKGHQSDKDEIVRLSREKQNVFQSMQIKKKEASQLEDNLKEYESQITEMQQTINALKREKDKAKKRAQFKKKREKAYDDDALPSFKDAYSEPVPRNRSSTTPAKYGTNRNNQSSKPFELIMEGIKMPNLQGLNLFNSVSNKTDPRSAPPFKVKPDKSDNNRLRPSYTSNMDSVSGSEQITDDDYTTGASSSESEGILEMKSTMSLDIAYDAPSEASVIYSWLHGQRESISSKNKKDVKQLKQRLASLLTSRSELYRQTMIQSYKTQYGLNMEKDIQKIIVKGHCMEMIHGLLMTSAQYDAILIKEYITDRDTRPVADIICCRSMSQLKELYEAYKQKCKLDLRKQLQALAKNKKKKTLVKVIGNILDLNRKEDVNVDENQVNSDLNFVLQTKSFKGDNKERLVLIFTANSVQYIKVLNEQYKLKAKDSLTVFVDKRLGPKSAVGMFCKTRILYALDTGDYYAFKIKTLGKQFKKNRKRISDILIQRMEIDLNKIQSVWKMKRYGDGKDLKTWIVGKTGGSKAGYFMSKMLDNCGRYASFRKNDGRIQPKNKFEQMMMGD